MFRVQGPGFRVQGSGSSVQCSVFSVQCSVFSVQCSVFSVQSSEFRVKSLGFEVQGSGVCKAIQILHLVSGSECLKRQPQHLLECEDLDHGLGVVPHSPTPANGQLQTAHRIPYARTPKEAQLLHSKDQVHEKSPKPEPPSVDRTGAPRS